MADLAKSRMYWKSAEEMKISLFSLAKLCRMKRLKTKPPSSQTERVAIPPK